MCYPFELFDDYLCLNQCVDWLPGSGSAFGMRIRIQEVKISKNPEKNRNKRS
jgi:hypothetical protein